MLAIVSHLPHRTMVRSAQSGRRATPFDGVGSRDAHCGHHVLLFPTPYDEDENKG